ncbi:proteasome maturation factor UMP1 [Patellaria atrata CBS 101060]|uniref:Proteasome maturation factor UMP1 n=1 Tax=Patellaria atrata CBS 101060 TaxID=1346257 RepID=A0A9P4VQW5_9PEZI|nr:proteasome maturation factor UMP1 [Patellaria atrata CBS 101060]
MSLRIVPASSNPSRSTPGPSAPSAPGIHDTLRSNLSLNAPAPAPTSSSSPAPVQSTHPLEARLANWRATQDALKMQTLRMQFGIAEPVRRGMELKITGMGEWKPATLGGSASVHRDVLEGRDCEIGWEDVFKGDEMRDLPDFHTEMEARAKMNW